MAEHGADDSGTSRRPLWAASGCGWALLVVVELLVQVSPVSARLVPTGLRPLLLCIALALTGGSFLWELRGGPGRQAPMGTLAFAVLLLTVPLVVVVHSISVIASTAVLSAGLFTFGVFAIVGVLTDSRKGKALAALPLALFALVGAALVPAGVQRDLRARTRACYANQKTIAGSIEMYNLDRATKVTGLTPELFRTLKSGGYLQSIPDASCAGPGSPASLHVVRDGNRVQCDVHGSIQ